MTNKPKLLDVALAHFRIGQITLPIKAGTKEPLVPWKRISEGAPPTEEQLRAWFTKPHVQALAVLLGQVSKNLVCRDFDDLGAYEAWSAEFPELARTLPTVSTGRPGRHV